MLTGKKGLIIGLANENSIAFGCAKILKQQGAELILTHRSEKSYKQARFLANELSADLYQCDVTNQENIKQLFPYIKKKWQTLDFVIHSLAFAKPRELQGRLVDTSSQAFLQAMDISCHSFLRIAQQAESLMPNGGSLISMSYLGAQKVMKNYNMMGPIKAALEASIKYLAVELAEKNIRVYGISPGLMPTRAATGIKNLDQLLAATTRKSPMQRIINQEEVGALASFLVSDFASGMTGQTLFVDGGYNLIN
ncbi:Enoyl-[acyl-carrier-protein] reductase [NADPH] FabI [Piscirickettsia salmonis]|uniref:Enoyl-[acyl-carrier-protein] reductase [NADH] n=1 Tax=Piscirickettsia salmonis TaxID=1238 RepID=A0A1L6TFL2_PISSA|nr:enoyl-ACP reductase FabI [Piscirickettsia salmonis]AKP72257.1 enoyl-ACP reductase [Piscirickettsia salmonis LF-89 = ATCC VR-1361]ALB24307.1 short-chain dehydrogenase [Piscirickettsia salmonis]ALY04101.1 enoyl-ACP reductase [Piscirickettsia salmonis]AMA43656.1 enoyl-ACP reductase [Piscirickettsia salmonis]AOS36123.1 enoyl-ACP reductase [Piscirickettsia salmonis]